ncbi:MAG: hypothetical protein QG629_916 [Patescibacteria group bacterium]|nr:hypothetical protein [Candidatus Saccharibacteria bacterium]MDQ5963833.1 hypothetical protein [Patescibacteria group bacterium]
MRSAELLDFPPLEISKTVDPTFQQAFSLIGEWRSFLTGKTPETMRVDCFIGSGFVRNGELPKLLNVIESLSKTDIRQDLIDNHYVEQRQIDNVLNKLLPMLKASKENGKDVFIVSGGYVPRRLTLKDWAKDI